MISLIEFLDSNPDFFKEGSAYSTCPWTEGPSSFPFCMDTKMKYSESGELEFRDDEYTDSIATLNLKSWTIEYDSKKYTIDKSNSGYMEEKPGYYGALKIHTVHGNDPTVTELHTLSLRLI